MIACPKCGSATRVLESRTKGRATRRSRVCRNLRCGHPSTTIEVIVEQPRKVPQPVVIARAELQAMRDTLDAALSNNADGDPGVAEPCGSVDPDDHDD